MVPIRLDIHLWLTDLATAPNALKQTVQILENLIARIDEEEDDKTEKEEK